MFVCICLCVWLIRKAARAKQLANRYCEMIKLADNVLVSPRVSEIIQPSILAVMDDAISIIADQHGIHDKNGAFAIPLSSIPNLVMDLYFIGYQIKCMQYLFHDVSQSHG